MEKNWDCSLLRSPFWYADITIDGRKMSRMSRANNQWLWDTAENESKHTGRRLFCECERGHEFQKIPISWKRKRSCTEHTSGCGL